MTMVQRSTTHIVRSDSLMKCIADLYSERAVRGGMTTAKADLIFGLRSSSKIVCQKPVYDKIRKDDAAFYAGLTKAGFRLDFGNNGSGLFMKYLRRGSGYYIDVGASQLVVDGKVKLVTSRSRKSRPTASSSTTATAADVIVHATGYSSMNGFVADLVAEKWPKRSARSGGSASTRPRTPAHGKANSANACEADGGAMVPRRRSHRRILAAASPSVKAR